MTNGTVIDLITNTNMLTTLQRISSIRAITRLVTHRSSAKLSLLQCRSTPHFIDKPDGRSYATKCTNNIYNIFADNKRPNTHVFSFSEQYRKYSNNKSENKQVEAEQIDEADNNEEEIPLLEINESYLDTQKRSIETVLRRDLQARDVKVYDFRDLNLTSNCGVSFEIEIWCDAFKDKTLLQQHRMVIDTMQHYNKASSSAKEQLLDIDNFHSIVIRTHV